MSEITSPALPAWVYERDGRLAPFDPDRVCQALFAAAEAVGRPDPFLARELTDGVLHFLAAETTGAFPTTSQIAEVIVKVVRELGHPALALAYLERRRADRPAPATPPHREFVVRCAPDVPPREVVRRCLREYSLRAVFSRDLAAAQADGLLTLACLSGPAELCASALTGTDGDPRGQAAGFVALDGPEHGLAGPGDEALDAFAARLQSSLEAAGVRAVVNLNCAARPAWAEESAGGPLFGGGQGTGPDRSGEAAALLERLAGTDGLSRRVSVYWHLGERDFAGPPDGPSAQRLLRSARLALARPAVTLVFDRPRREVSLGPGLDRRHAAVLLAAGLHLPRLAELIPPDSPAPTVMQKLASLARLALSAASQKRAFLRRHSRDAGGPAARLARGFLLDRARLAVVPVGLEAAVRRLRGHGVCDSKPGQELARQMLLTLRGVVEREGAAAGLDVCLDGTAGGMEDWEPEGGDDWPAPSEELTGPAVLGPASPPRAQLRAAGALHAAAGRGTAVVVLPPGDALAPGELVALLHHAWKQTEVARLRLLTAAEPPRQPTLPGL